jgi:serine/threonine protein kinase
MQQTILKRRYKIVQLIGTGRTATVFQAQDLKEHRTVALKALNPEFFTDRRKLERVKHELKQAMNLRHTNITHIFDFWDDKGTLYVVSEYINGITLAELIKSRRLLSVNEALTIIMPVLRALDYAHRQRILHYDLSPTNIMLTGTGQPKIMDYGLSKTYLTDPASYFWSPVYLAPEQLQNISLPANDLYSVGALLYEMLSGQPVYEGAPATVVNKIIYETPPALFYVNPSFNQDVDNLVMKALAKNPEQRYVSASDMYDAVVQCLENNGGKVSIVSLVGKFSGISLIPTKSISSPTTAHVRFQAKNLASQRMFMTGLGAAFALLILVAIILVFFPRPAESRLQTTNSVAIVVAATPILRPFTLTSTVAPTINTANQIASALPPTLTPIPTPTLPASISVQTAIAQNCNALFDEAGVAFNARNWNSAVTLYEQILATLPTCRQDEVRSRIAGAYFELEQFDRAVAGYAYIEINFPQYRPEDIKRDLAESYCRHGMSMFRNQAIEKVLPPLGECVKRNPQFPFAASALSAELNYKEGYDAARAKNWASAVDKLAKAYEFDDKFRDTAPILFDAYLQYGGQLVAQSKFKEATAVYDRARKMKSAPQVDSVRADQLYQDTAKR